MKMKNYKNEHAAAKGLLGESIKIMNESNLDYVVVGGWIPYLFYTNKKYSHPGSFDVDILLNDKIVNIKSIEKLIQNFRKHNYIFSAKNKFQLHKILKVNKEPMVFHVDFLHRKYAPDQDEGMFLDWGKMTSIAGPGMDIIFDRNERITHTISCILPNGIKENVIVNFASEIGFITSKGRSLNNPKRTRDSYDLFLIMKDANSELLAKSKYYYKNYGIYKISIDNILDFFKKGNGFLNTTKYIEKYSDQNTKDTIAKKLINDTVINFLNKTIN